MVKTVKITCDDLEYNLDTTKDITILELALENDVDAPYSCQGGICSTCMARVIKGSVVMDNNQILTDEEVEEGLVLTCQSRITSNHIEVSYDDI
ncbi:MAG TPA: 2Fe-2S iron-sulfur cluster binding domain-containing protein [Flavobacteriaceae bacterium]|jgi:ring-1,2-phenylacetyl-CoA epoxidase subunit PaaE|nr:2Fe-2S iron-sulfur cluster binding domain-containing protein [Flavobacteriaceae bacterium]|tara:strand:- start:197 stop:478 length:282 start_codon:yes stop_codon:yes gene_type:complete